MSTQTAVIAVPNILPASTNSTRTVWLGSASFEERCVASLLHLNHEGIRVDHVVLLTYDTSVVPSASGEDQRAENTRVMISLSQELTSENPEAIALPAYSYGAAQRLMGMLLKAGYGRLVVDITCLTKIHTLAIAAVVSGARQGIEVWLAYAVPENYPGISWPNHQPEGWQDVIVAPLSEAARFFNENSGRGIVMVGHEVDRLIVGLAEIEPAGGTIIVASSPRRPDIGEVSVRRNQKVMRQLLAMRSADWRRKRIDLCDCDAIAAVVDEEVTRASAESAPVILFPYGPKPHLFTAAYELARRYYENGWFVYPIPISYDASYSEGIGQLIWFRLADETQAAC